MSERCGLRRAASGQAEGSGLAVQALAAAARAMAAAAVTSAQLSLQRWQGLGVCLRVSRQPLTPTDWARVPTPCPGLAAALPAVLARSEAGAALLVRHLPAGDRERLRTAAQCVRRTGRVLGSALPAPVVRLLLLAALQ